MHIVVTEDNYGGGEKYIKAFHKKEDAIKYQEFTANDKLDVRIIEFNSLYPEIIYIVVTEEWYGGNIAVFSILEDANDYKNKLHLDSIVLKYKIL